MVASLDNFVAQIATTLFEVNAVIVAVLLNLKGVVVTELGGVNLVVSGFLGDAQPVE